MKLLRHHILAFEMSGGIVAGLAIAAIVALFLILAGCETTDYIQIARRF